MFHNIHSSVMDWLSSGADCQVGIRLFISFTKATRLHQLVAANPSFYSQFVKDSLCHLAGITHGHTIKQNDASPPEPTKLTKPARSMRQDWPFLSDPSCPNELKVLVGDKITAWYNFSDSYYRIHTATTPADQSNLASYIVTNYLENYKIYQELKHYKQHGKVLGEHPIFAQMASFRAWKSLPPLTLSNMLKQVEYNIRRLQRQIKANDRPDLRISRERKLNNYIKEQSELRRLLS